MGVKRLLEEESLSELSFEHHKQIDNNKKLALAGVFPSNATAPQVDSHGEAKSDVCTFDSDGLLENGGIGDACIADKEVEASEEDVGIKNSSFCSNIRGCVDFDMPWRQPQLFDDPYVYLLNAAPRKEVPIGPDHQADIPEWNPSPKAKSSSESNNPGGDDWEQNSNFRDYIDFDMPWRPPQLFDDPYLYLINVAPRKEIPIGPDHQADVPEWDPSARAKSSPGSNNNVGNDREQKFIGTCIIPMPNLDDSTNDGFRVGRGRTSDCHCLDMGSMRCVQQHVREARENLQDTFGDEIFKNLGFYEMGEEIARSWRSKDQQLFHEVVFSNPGEDLWRHLSALFPTRSKKELVSYYFNVFVLRRRGVQNRSYLLQVDSDHDEVMTDDCEEYQIIRPLVDDDSKDGDDLQLVSGDFYLIGGGEDSEVDSFRDQELDASWADEYGNVCDDDGSNVEDGTFDGDVLEKDGVDEGSGDNHGTSDDSVPKQCAVEMDGGARQASGQETGM